MLESIVIIVIGIGAVSYLVYSFMPKKGKQNLCGSCSVCKKQCEVNPEVKIKKGE